MVAPAPAHPPPSPLPYHPVIADGMMRAYQDRGWISARGELGPEATCWPVVAPLVEEVWNRHAGSARPRRAVSIPDLPPELVEATLALAEAAEVRSFAQGLEAAGEYLLGGAGARFEMVASRVARTPIRLTEIRGLSLTAIEEGHTAGVLLIEVTLDHRAPVRFVLNVARDLSTSAARLRATASDLRVWHRRSPACAAAVLDEGFGLIRWFGQPRRVAIVATEWLDGHAVHVVPDVAGVQLVRVREPVRAGAALPELRGEILDDRAARQVASALAEVRTTLATFTCDGVAERLFDLNHGDAVVIGDQPHRIALVGSSALSWCGGLGEWPYRLGAFAARDRGTAQRRWLHLGHVAASVAAGLAAMRRSAVHELVAPMIAEALACDPEDAFPSGLSHVTCATIVGEVRAQLAAELAAAELAAVPP